MADRTGIEWTQATWNPITGCSLESPGCTGCYAMAMAHRLEAMGVAKYAGTTRLSGHRRVWTGKIVLDEGALDLPLRWRAPRQIFVNSMSDLGHPDVPAWFIAKVWQTMQAAPQHTYQVLTKRIERMADLLADSATFPRLPNVWLGTSIEARAQLFRLAHLRRASAAVRFVSFEPLLEDLGKLDLSAVDWAIVGGESGPRARLMRAEWVEGIHLAARRAGTAFLFKQWGGRNKKAAGREWRGRTWDEYPGATALAAHA